MEKIICGKFDNKIIINQTDLDRLSKQVRIGSLNPSKLEKRIFYPISTNGEMVLFDDKLFKTRDFLGTLDKEILKNMIVLTQKEREMILEQLIDFNLDINIFEALFPFFNHIKYISNIYKNYEELKKLLNIINKLDIKGKSIAHNLSTTYLYKVERKLRFKSQLDYFFAFSYKGGYQEVFKFKEERDDRVIIALDFNSMYIDSMMSEFIEPKSIKYINLKVEKKDTNDLHNGMYRVVLKNPKKGFFRHFHPFKYHNTFKAYYFNLESNQEIELFLFKNEIIYYQNFFESIEIIEGFFSTKNIEHPLKRYAIQTYNDRLKFKNDKNDIMESLSKFKLITIHSATSSKNYKTLFFKTKKTMISYLKYKYMLNFPDTLSEDEILHILSNNSYFLFKKYKNVYKAKMIDFENNKAIYSLSAQIIANSRLKMVQTIEKFLKHNTVEICYANIDSIHISISKSEVNNFLAKYNYMISNKIGDLKIETISEKGYWFDLGRYWLLTDNRVDIFKNTFFNHKANNKKFLKNRKINQLNKNKYLSFVKTFYINIYNSFSYNKKICHDNSNKNQDYMRYNYIEIKNLYVANESYNEEILKSKTLKCELFDYIATV